MDAAIHDEESDSITKLNPKMPRKKKLTRSLADSLKEIMNKIVMNILDSLMSLI